MDADSVAPASHVTTMLQCSFIASGCPSLALKPLPSFDQERERERAVKSDTQFEKAVKLSHLERRQIVIT